MPDPGWYDDPEDATQLRWWSGNRWTDRRMPRTEAGPPPAPGSGPGRTPSSERSAPSAGSSSTSGAPRDPWGSTPRSETGRGQGSGAGAGSTGWGPSASTTAVPSQGPWPAPPRTFVEAIKVCLTKYVDGKGRASRSEYWYFALFSFIVDLLTGGVAAIFLLLPSITVSVRRLHDIGKSAWALLWVFLPVIGWIILFYYSVKPGDPAPNAWG